MPVNVGQISVSLTANTASFTAELNKAEQQAAKSTGDIKSSLQKLTGALDDAGKKAATTGRHLGEIGHAVPQMSAASAAIRTLEGNFNNNIRAAERFIGTTLGLAPLLQKAFPVVGGIALLGVLSELAGKANEVFKEFRDAPDKLAGASER